MSKSSTKTSQTAKGTVTPNNLPAVQQGWNAAGYLLNGTQPGAPLVNQGMNLIGAGANAGSSAAIDALNRATTLAGPGGTTNAANGYLTPFANGSMTNSTNPYFQNMVDQMSRSIQGSTDGGFAADGRYGSGANANAFDSSLANATGQMAYQNYSDALNRQTGAADQLSTNNTNSTSQALAALNAVPALSGAATGAGGAAVAGGLAPTAGYANTINALGTGGGTTNSSGTGTSKTSGMNLTDAFSAFSALFPKGI